MDLKEGIKDKFKLSKAIVMLLVFVIGLVTFGLNIDQAQAQTVLPQVVGGRRFSSVNSSGSGGNTPLRYKYLLGGDTSYGFLPKVSRLNEHGYNNLGWGLNTPSRNELVGEGVSRGGREFTHSVYPSQTKFHTVGGREYLRISGSAVLTDYFHHTSTNHEIAILTREDGKANSIKLWRATLVNHTSSASYDYGYGSVDGESDWRATVNQSGHGLMPLHVSNDPYPYTAKTVNRSSDSLYFDHGNRNLLNNNYTSWINREQVSKLSGLGVVGARLTTTAGSTYILDYTGFVVDIPVDALISDGSKSHTYDFNIVMTMSTPNGHKARVMGQTLGIPGMSSKTTTSIDETRGRVGDIELKQSNVEGIRYTPYEILLRNFKRTSNFTATEYQHNLLSRRPSDNTVLRTRTFEASSSRPRMVGGTVSEQWMTNLGYALIPRFSEKSVAEINTRAGRRSADFVEMRHNGRGEMWVGWTVPSISKSQKIYTTVGNAYDDIPKATMTYTPRNQNHKPIVVRHRIVQNNNFGSPGTIFRQDKYSSQRGGSGFTVRPLSGSDLSSLGRNMSFTGRYRIGGDPSDPVARLSGSSTISNSNLFSATNNGSDTLFIDLYYSGTPDVPDTNLNGMLTLRERHRRVGNTSAVIAGTSVDHSVGLGESVTITRQRPYGYEYTRPGGYYQVDNGNNVRSTSYTVRNTRQNSNWRQDVVFYYALREFNYTVEHRNLATGNRIAQNGSGVLTSTNPNSPSTAIARPLTGNNLPDGYTYQGQYSVNGGSRRNGTSYTITYDDESNNMVVSFFYDWNEPEETTKRFQGDDTSEPRPLDTYINAGIVTERNSNDIVVHSSLQANTSAVLDTYEAPIAIVPNRSTLSIHTESGNSGTVRAPLNRSIRVYNDEFLNSLRVDNRVGGSRDANGNQATGVRLSSRALTHVNVAMSLGQVNSTEDLQELALGQSGATVGVNEDRDYVGRWLDSGAYYMDRWTPSGVNQQLVRNLNYGSGLAINDMTEVRATYDVEIYNRLKHNYEPRVGSDGLEYYEYVGSEFLEGYYRYNERGERVGNLQDRNVTQTTILDVSDIGVREYVDSKGFNVGAGQIAPAQFKIASELFDNGGRTIRGYGSEALPNEGAVDPVVRRENTNYRVTPSTGQTPRVDYYEEFGYAPFHTEEEVMTQQAIPVGGKVTYVNPYEYFMLPSFARLSVMEQSGVTIGDIRNNVTRFRNTGELDSSVVFSPEHTGYYMSEVDEFEEFENAIPNVIQANKNYMESVVRLTNQYNPVRPNELKTRNYRTYDNLVTGSTSRYTPVGSVQSINNLTKRLPITYINGMNEFILEDVVAVGQDTGYPVVSQPDTIEADYRARYRADNGVEPSSSDKLVTMNKGSIYLIPLNNRGQSVDDVYNTRLFVNGIGISQFNLVDESEIGFEKYLYGRGDNVIYSGEREEVEVGNEFNSDQIIEQGATPEDATQINGIRTNNNKEINDRVLDGE